MTAGATPPKPAFDDYRPWAKSELRVDFDDDDTRLFYQSGQSFVDDTLTAHPFFQQLQVMLETLSDTYGAGKYELFMQGRAPEVKGLKFDRKSYDSAVNKSYRINVLHNRNWPNEPSSKGWCTPDTWFEILDDVVRTTFFCKYLDGPKIVAEALKAHATSTGLVGDWKARASDDGYYAYHFYVTIPTVLLLPNATRTTVNAVVEFQLATQLQEVLYQLTHGPYETRRLSADRTQDWKWDPTSDRFNLAYLGHTLHMLEGMILNFKAQDIEHLEEGK